MYRLLITLALGTFAVGTAGFVTAGILPQISDSFGVGVATAGLLVTVFAIAYAVCAPVLAAATGRWPRRVLLTASLAVFVVGGVATALAPTFGLALGGWVVTAVGAALFVPTASVTAATLVAPEQRGRALSIVLGGTTVGSALSVPIGTALGAAFGWRVTIWFVAALGVIAALGIIALLPAVPTPPAVGLRRRLAPLGDRRVTTVLLVTLLVMAGGYTVYTYVSLVFDRATGGDGTTLAVLLFAFGIGGVVGNLGAGGLTDRLGSRSVLNLAVVILAIDFALLPLSSAYFSTGLIAVAVWGMSGWAILVPQQYRLIATSPGSAPLVIALNSSALYFGVALSGPIGAAGIGFVGAHQLGLLAAGLLLLGLLTSEVAHRFGRQGETRDAPTPAAKTVSGAPTKTEGDGPPTGGEAAPVRPEHRGHT